MKITIPYTYTEEVVPPRCRKPRRVRQVASISLSIHEIKSEEAPIAIVEHSHDWSEKGKRYPTEKIYRWWRNQLYVRYSFQRTSGGEYETQAAEGFTADPYPFHLSLGANHWDSSGYRSKSEQRQAKMEWARGVLFIDGQRWQAVPEPRYVIMTFGLGHNHAGWGTSLSATSYYNSNIGRSRYYRIDQYQEAIQAAEQIAVRRGDTNSIPMESVQDPTRFDILIPEAIRLRPHKEHGNGDAFTNRAEQIIESSPCGLMAGLLLIGEVRASL